MSPARRRSTRVRRSDRASRALLALVVGAWAAGCSGMDLAGEPAGAEGNGQAIAAGPSCGSLPYPVAVVADPAAEERARKALAQLSPGARLAWSSVRGTLQTLTGLDLLLEGCQGASPVAAHLLPLLEGHPDLFQLDGAEWTGSVVSCAQVPAAGLSFGLNRRQFAGQRIERDRVSVRLVREAKGVVVKSVVGTYLPVAPAGLAKALANCPGLDAALATKTAYNQRYPFTRFYQCQYLGSGVYSPRAADAVELDLAASWGWYEASGKVFLESTTRGALRLSRPYPSDILQSDAYCEMTDVAGFSFRFDTVLTRWLSSTPGIDGCITCVR